jgi:heat-inducible transcriptional repressor
VPEVTLVLAHFGTPSTHAGVLGIVGPTRLPYERAVPTVGYMARLMTGLLARRAEAAAT